jgi:hypothetical protein
LERLAHRGWWREPAEKNTQAAFERALRAGYGIETDLRDHLGKIVISHDPPGREQETELEFEALLQLYRRLGATGTLALNIKADGLAAEVSELLCRYEMPPHFVFDMSIPDMLAYSRRGMRFFTRQSEFETPVRLESDFGGGAAAGIWLDSFSPIWYSPNLIRQHLDSGLDVCLVSPELHKREPQPWWSELKRFLERCELDEAKRPGRLMLCTDFPNEF